MTTTRTPPPRRSNRAVRTAGLVLAAVAVAGAAFAAVLRFQPAVPPATAAGGGPAVIATDPGPDPPLAHGLGPGDGVWVNSYDGGRLSSQFRGAEYTPHKDGTIHVVRPQSVFYMGRGQVMVVTGDTGEVAFDVPAGGGDGMPSAMRSPDKGRLHHVHIELRPSLDGRATLRMDTDNVRFDNDTLRIYTERVPAGVAPAAPTLEVPADRVPVTIRGDDYEMDGTGLTLRWDGLDRRLHLMEIAHGDRLTILHPGRTNRATATDAVPPKAGSEARRTPGSDAGPPTASVAPLNQTGTPPAAAADPKVVTQAAPTALPTTAPAPAPPYRAVFDDDVKIVQGGGPGAATAARTIGTGDVLTLDFLDGKTAATQPATTPQPAPTIQPLATPQPVTTTRRATTTASLPTARPPVTAAPVGAASTRPSDEPVTIYWTGKLRVTPLESAPPMMPLEHGQSVVRLVGRPAVLSYNGATAEAAAATYRTGDDAVRLDPSAADPAVRVDQPQKQLKLVARAVAFDPAVSVATITGPATLAVGEAAGRTMTATWADRGLLHVVTAGTDPAGVDHVDLAGDVHADDPQFSLVGRRLLLDLDVVRPTAAPTAAPTTAPATRPAGEAGPQERLRRLTAVGGVACRLLRPGEPDQGIEADRLVVGMAPTGTGGPVPRDVVADGRQVRAFDATQALYADHLEATLAPKPTTQPTTRGADDAPAVALDTLLAAGHVRAVLKDGSTAVADTLREATAADGRQLVELADAAGARVTGPKRDDLVGSVLHVAIDRGGAAGVVVVDGPGTLHTVGKPTADARAGRPVDVSWTDALTFDAAANTADVVGHVLVRSVGADGTVDTAAGDTAHLDLADASPSTRPTTVPAGNAMGAKRLVAVTLAGHVHATSDLDERGLVVRHAELLDAARLVYTDADGIARVPGPGRMLIENHRPPAGGLVAAAAGGHYGVMAVRWHDRLAYDRAAGRVTFDGRVHLGFEQDAQHPAASGPVQMQSDQMVILTDASKPGKTQVSSLVATGAVHCLAGSLDVYCHRADFRPDTGRLVATASDAEPGRATQAPGKGGGSSDGGFERMEFDTVGQEIVQGSGMTATMRR